MKQIGLLNQPLSTVVSGMGHLDTLVIADAGLPIPSGTERIDLAVAKGIPGFIDTLRATLTELKIESVIIADGMAEHSPSIRAALDELIGDVPVHTVSHDTFKAQSASARAIVRTGEFSPYANIILVAGVVF